MSAEADYAEARAWATWLDTFTASDLADSMGVTTAAVQGFMIGLMFNGTIADTGDRAPGADGRDEPIFNFVPLPAGPNEHWTDQPPEQTTPGTYDLAPVRGMPVFLEDHGERGRIMSTPGARHRVKLRQLARERMENAQQERADQQRRKAKVAA